MKTKLLACLAVLLALVSHSYAQDKRVTGTVTQEDTQQALAGVSVLIKETGRSTYTDADGRFAILVKPEERTLIFTYVGFDKQEAAITDAPVNISLRSASNTLNEVLVVAYGTANKTTYTGSASVVNAEQIQRQQVSTLSRSLQGLAPGVQSIASAGQPGSDATLRIRGIGSVNASSTPLYVVDGVPFSGNINAISPNDVQSITVLKDASASALYGSRGANGVVIITSKQGKLNTKPQVSLNASTGLSSRAVADYGFVNTQQYFELEWEALRNNQLDQGKTAALAAQYATNELVSTLKINPFGTAYPNPVGLDGKLVAGAVPLWNDDWAESLSRTGIRNELSLGISGGSADSKYFVSGGYLSDKGFIVASGFQRFNTRVNYNTRVNNWFEAGLNVTASSTSQDSPPQTDSSQGNFANFPRLVSNIYPVYERNADGSYKLDENGNRIYDFGNYRPSSAATGNNLLGGADLNKYSSKNDALTFRGNIQLNIANGLKLKSSLNADYNSRLGHSYTNPILGTGVSGGGSVSKSSARGLGYTFNNLLSYTFDLAANHFDLLGGQEVYNYNTSSLSGSRSNFGFADKDEPAAASLLNSFSGSSDNYKLASFLGKIDYNFDGRYYFSASFRRDGSSRFSADSRWGNFWSFGASWNAKSESFLQDAGWLNSLSFKGSYGAQGNDNLGSYYAYRGLYSIYNSLGNAGLISSRLPTPGLKWETNLNLNIGTDFALFDNRLSGSFEVYNRSSKDLLFSRPLSPSLGFTDIDDNIGSLKNTGFEGNLQVSPVRNKVFRWDLGVNFGHYKNKITKLPQKEIIAGAIGQLGSTKKLTVGSSVYDFYIREWAGVDPANGKPLWYKDVISSGQVTGRTTTSVFADASQYFQGSALPDLYGGVTNNFRYRNFSLSAVLAYNLGGKILDLDEVMISHNGEGIGRTWSADILDRWTPEHTSTDVPRLSTIATNWNSISTRFLYNATYARLKNVNLGYDLPGALAKRIGVKDVRVFASGENLVTLFGHDGLDPEQAVDGVTFYRYPAQKTFSFGLNLSF
ncbi:SusC/RagA family TonB-linked outer membrane protein [Hufsiella ginkgonis]|uniref:SusC/RagA family TonB-linked outer membrane protein n=1 Tax=Hufsiella ginkgonis TaxID=2695274 RepID=A0A7K1XUU6_9SPHI|nr:TonB-dependent receptor [Hufsiella ginkgonis]MXV14568.1 SusC/RagA family TonB-linked outer membrane protein [Hufsiella ginkgonis]